MRNGTQTTAVRIEDEHLSPLGPNGRVFATTRTVRRPDRVDDDKTLPFLDEPRSNLPDAETTTSFAPDEEITSNSPDGSAELADGTSTAAATRHTANTRTNELSARPSRPRVQLGKEHRTPLTCRREPAQADGDIDGLDLAEAPAEQALLVYE